jgi:integrase
VDVHSLRHTFATLLARNGVTPSVAQKLMRHSDIRLTMNTYTHLDLADTAGAVAALPAF